VDKAGNATLAKAWYDNRGYHAAAAFSNALSNMVLRASVPDNAEEYGITAYNHPLTLSKHQLSLRDTLEKTADLGISVTLLTAFSFIPAGNGNG